MPNVANETSASTSGFGMVGSPNKFKLAVFGLNVSNGCSVTAAEGVFSGKWEDAKALALTADRIGIEALVSVARWRGFAGATNFNDHSYDTLTWAAGLAAVTDRIQIFSTVHVPTVHPVRMAKAAATIDAISGGRFGLNIVAGWNAGEIGMFGTPQKEHDERYAVSAEWIDIIRRLWTEDTFDYEGKYYSVPGGHSEPKPIQRPGPIVMCAGASKAGSDFAAEHADCQFIGTMGIEGLKERVAGLKKDAREKYGKDIRVFTTTYIMCRDTEQEARDYYQYAVNEKGDWEGARNLVRGMLPNVENAVGDDAMVASLIAGYGGFPLIGTPDQVVAGMKDLSDAGLDGVTVSFVDYQDGLSRMERDILPRMQAAGLRA